MMKFVLLFTLLLSFNVNAKLCNAVFRGETSPSSFVISIDNNAEIILRKSFENATQESQTEQLLELLRVIQNRGIEGLSASEIALLKTTRKNFAILRSALQITSETHEVPNEFSNFVKYFGQLNDRIAISQDYKTQKLASKMLTSFERSDLQFVLNNTKVASPDSVITYYKNIRKDTRRLMSNTKITVHDFHAIRKNLKEFLTFYSLKKELNPAITDHPEYEYLFELNGDLGDLNDLFTKKMLEKKSFTAHSKAKFPEVLRNKVEYFLKNLNI